MKPRFISVEGLEGAGKTTQLQVVTDFVTAHYGPPRVTREPGGTPLAEDIRSVILSPRTEPMDAWTELLLVFAARKQHVATVIQPALASGQWVVSDRFTDATYAYQGGGRQLPWEHIQALEELVLDGFQPDLTLWLDCPAELGLQRARQRGALDRIELEDIAFFERCRKAYEKRAQAAPQRFVRIDASRSLEEVSAQVRQTLEQQL
ncbi:MAG: dTMP kinase [Saccharospirillum sp.]|nr:dTMP kinase [Saccharospirillum sp.]